MVDDFLYFVDDALDPRATQDTDRQVGAASDLALRLLTATITSEPG